jgi:hypothetical protein
MEVQHFLVPLRDGLHLMVGLVANTVVNEVQSDGWKRFQK